MGYRHRKKSEQGFIFTSKRWKQLMDVSGIEIRIPDIKTHISIGTGKILHDLLRCIYPKIRHFHDNAHPKVALNFGVKLMNDTLGEIEPVPSRRVFGTIYTFPIINTDLPKRAESLKSLATAQAEMNVI